MHPSTSLASSRQTKRLARSSGFLRKVAKSTVSGFSVSKNVQASASVLHCPRSESKDAHLANNLWASAERPADKQLPRREQLKGVVAAALEDAEEGANPTMQRRLVKLAEQLAPFVGIRMIIDSNIWRPPILVTAPMYRRRGRRRSHRQLACLPSRRS